MSRDVTVKDVQNAISILQSWANNDCPDWAKSLMRSIADIVEQILCSRDKEIKDN